VSKADERPRVWWLSFHDEDEGHQGVIVVDAVTFDDAMAQVERVPGLHPGGACFSRGEAPELYPPTRRRIVAAVPRLTLLSHAQLAVLRVFVDDVE
jgi:hypothetical protein